MIKFKVIKIEDPEKLLITLQVVNSNGYEKYETISPRKEYVFQSEGTARIQRVVLHWMMTSSEQSIPVKYRVEWFALEDEKDSKEPAILAPQKEKTFQKTEIIGPGLNRAVLSFRESGKNFRDSF